jgi:hypothetical protein
MKDGLPVIYCHDSDGNPGMMFGPFHRGSGGWRRAGAAADRLGDELLRRDDREVRPLKLSTASSRSVVDPRYNGG